MSWQNNFSSSNNLYSNSPPIMHDGRNYATYRPDELLNQQILVENKIMTNNDYKRYLTNNAEKIIETNQLESCNETNCFRSFNKPENGLVGQPYFYKSNIDNNQPYGYYQSDLKQVYLSRDQLQSRMFAPSMKVNKNLDK